jgi:Protein of unknown function (DUF2924)
MSPRSFDAAAVEAEVDRIRSFGIAALRARWHLMFGDPPPAGLSKDIIKRCWQGATYTSLSTIARTITGTAWNGPRFFGLREAARKQVKGSALASAPKRKPHRGRRPSIRPRPESRPEAG